MAKRKPAAPKEKSHACGMRTQRGGACKLHVLKATYCHHHTNGPVRRKTYVRKPKAPERPKLKRLHRNSEKGSERPKLKRLHRNSERDGASPDF